MKKHRSTAGTGRSNRRLSAAAASHASTRWKDVSEALQTLKDGNFDPIEPTRLRAVGQSDLGLPSAKDALSPRKPHELDQAERAQDFEKRKVVGTVGYFQLGPHRKRR